VRGRKPRPAALRRLGPRSHHRSNPVVEVPTEDPGDTFDLAPAGLTGAAADEWTRLAPLLRRRGQVGESDRSCLYAACTEWAVYLTATAHAGPLVVKAPSGAPMKNPNRQVARDALTLLAKLWAELGLTPSSRTRVHMMSKPADSWVKRYMASGPKLRVVKS
jgi:P27 family predicted phage terminase small subunit